jgi:hypothetical protein
MSSIHSQVTKYKADLNSSINELINGLSKKCNVNDPITIDALASKSLSETLDPELTEPLEKFLECVRFFKSITEEFECAIHYFPDEKRIDIQTDYMAKSYLDKKIIEGRKFRIFQDHTNVYDETEYTDHYDYTWFNFRVLWYFEYPID